MSKWKKSSPELVAAFDAALPLFPAVERRQMFGYPCAFVNGNMAVGLHEDRLIARLPAEAASHPCVMLGRTMREYAAIDNAVELDARSLKDWIDRALGYTATLAPKAAKAAKPPPARKSKKV